MYQLRENASEAHGLALRPVAGAVAPAPVLGLSKSHIRPLPTVTFYVGGSLVRFDSREPGERHGACPKRSEISEFSEKSRQRLRLSLAKVDQGKCGRPIFGTLTYPADFPLDQETFKRHLKIFSQRFLRSFPSAGFHWKLEFQARGAAHFHPIFWNFSSDDGEFLREFRGWLADNWSEVVHSGDEKHLLAGTSADPIKSQFGIMRYVSGYASKSDQTKPGCKVGRYWGIVGRANIPWATECVIQLSSAQANLVRRTARRYMQAMNRIRRIRRLENLLPKQMCAAFMLNGDLRRFRKRCPDAKIFQQLPRKLRLKNNRNVNLFCDAAFWREGLASLIISGEGSASAVKVTVAAAWDAALELTPVSASVKVSVSELV